MKIPGNTILHTPFFDNFFCLIPNTNLAFVAISKNAVTFLKKVALYNKTNQWPGANEDPHNAIGFTEDSDYLIPVTEMDEYEKKNGKLIKFAVWRDPIKRIESTYKLFCIERKYRHYFHYLGLFHDNSFENFMVFLEFEWNKKYSNLQDEHIRRQVDYYSVSDVNYIVPIEKIQHFLSEFKVPYVAEQSNNTNSKFSISNEVHLARIKEYYKDDWKIRWNY